MIGGRREIPAFMFRLCIWSRDWSNRAAFYGGSDEALLSIE
jgi:hypothetical protein